MNVPIYAPPPPQTQALSALNPLKRHALPYGLLLLFCLLACQGAWALPFDIPEEDLPAALLRFSQQSGLNVIRDGSVSGLRSRAVKGDYSAAQALRLMLADTGLEFVSSASGMRILHPQDAEEGVQQLPALDIIGTHSPVFDKYKTPEIKYEVTREQLDRVPYSRIGDIFNGVPGVASADSANGAGLELNIRGLQGMGRVKTLVDGSMQTTNTYRGYAGNRDTTFIDPDLIGGIDIKKGPDAGPQGAGVIGGIVNMRTLTASDIITDPDKNWGIRLKGMYGDNVARDKFIYKERTQSFSTTRRYYDFHKVERRSGRGLTGTCRADNAWRCANPSGKETYIGGKIPTENQSGSLAVAFRPWDNFELTLAYAERESGNYYYGQHGRNFWNEHYNKGYQRNDKNDAESPNTSHRSESWLAKSKLIFAEAHTLELSHMKYRTQFGQSIPGLDTTMPPTFAQGHLRNAESTTYSLNYAWQPDNPWLDLRTNLWKSRLYSETPSGIYEEWFGMRDSEVIVDSYGGELWNSSHFDFLLGEFSLKYGVSFSHEKAYGYEIHRSSGRSSATVVNGTRDIFGAFTQANWQATPWLALNAGLQHTQGRLEDKTPRDARLPASSYPPLPLNRQRALDPSYGFTLEPHRSVQFFAQWSQGSRMPTVRESLMPSASASVAPNPDLKMERAENFEYGVNLLFDSLLSSGDSLGIKFSKFDNKYKDYIIRQHRQLMGEQRPFPRPYQNVSYKFFNIDRARYQGYEISADYDNGWLFGNFSLVHFDKIQYCYVTSNSFRNSASIVPLPEACYKTPPTTDYVWGNYVPPSQEKNAGLGVRLFDQKLVLGATMKMASKSALMNENISGTPPDYFRQPNYEIYDLYGQLKLTKNLEIGFSVENIRDRYYLPAYSSPTELQPAPGRTARGMFTFRF